MTVAPSAASTLVSLADSALCCAVCPTPTRPPPACCRAREPQLTKPPGSLGRLEQIVAHLSVWQGRHPPRLETVRACIFAGNHGVAALGVSAYPAEVTAQMVANFQHGGAAINQLCRVNGITLSVEALELDRPTADFTRSPAMTESDCVIAFARGMAAVLPGTDLLVRRRDGNRQHEFGRGLDLLCPVWRRGLRLDRARHRRRRRPSPAIKIDTVTKARRAPRRRPRRPARDPASPRRPRNRGDGRRDRGRAVEPHAGAARRICLRRRRRRAACRSPRARSTIVWRPMFRPRRGHRRRCNSWVKRRCSTSACGSARARARRWRSDLRARRWPATSAWRPSRKPASAIGVTMRTRRSSRRDASTLDVCARRAL